MKEGVGGSWRGEIQTLSRKQSDICFLLCFGCDKPQHHLQPFCPAQLKKLPFLNLLIYMQKFHTQKWPTTSNTACHVDVILNQRLSEEFYNLMNMQSTCWCHTWKTHKKRRFPAASCWESTCETNHKSANVKCVFLLSVDMLLYL